MSAILSASSRITISTSSKKTFSDKEYFGDVNIGEVFRLRPDSQAKTFRKVKDGTALDVREMKEVQLGDRDEIYVKS